MSDETIRLTPADTAPLLASMLHGRVSAALAEALDVVDARHHGLEYVVGDLHALAAALATAVCAALTHETYARALAVLAARATEETR